MVVGTFCNTVALPGRWKYLEAYIIENIVRRWQPTQTEECHCKLDYEQQCSVQHSATALENVTEKEIINICQIVIDII